MQYYIEKTADAVCKRKTHQMQCVEEKTKDNSLIFFREMFFKIVKEQCSNSFKMNIDKILGHLSASGTVVDENIRSLFFGDYMIAENKVYDEVTDLKQLTEVIEK